jgi:hypothetical chaperone protein
MPRFGKGVTRMPMHQFVDALLVQDAPRQHAFQQRDFGEVPAPFGARLQALQRDGGSTRLYRGVEGMKIELSARETASHCLDYVDPALRISSHRADLEDAGGAFVQRLQGLLREVRAQLGSPPDSLFLTGGMSRAPYLRAAAQAVFSEARRVHGEASLGVVPGLASHGA